MSGREFYSNYLFCSNSCFGQNVDKPFGQKLSEIDEQLEKLTALYHSVVEKNVGKKREGGKGNTFHLLT